MKDYDNLKACVQSQPTESPYLTMWLLQEKVQTPSAPLDSSDPGQAHPGHAHTVREPKTSISPQP